MANTLLRDKARILRAKGASLKEIARRFDVPKSTVRYWCRDIVLSDAQQRHLFENQRLGGIRAAERMRLRRLRLVKRIYLDGKREIGDLSERERFLIGTALYWAEGYRKGDGEFGFTNADPAMIQFMIRWLHENCEVPRRDIHLRLCITVLFKRRVPALQRFWARATGISITQFSKPTLIRSVNRKKYIDSSNYYGTLRVKVRRSVNLRRKIMGWIAGIAG